MDDDAVYQNGADVYTRPESRGVLPTILTWLLATTALGWIAASAWYIDRVLGWQTVPELLPHEIGGLIAGMLAPPAVLFALAAWIVRDQQLAFDVSVLEHQIWRLENPHKRAEANLNEVGQGLLVYATALESAVDKAQLQLENLHGGFDQKVSELESVAQSVRASTIDSGETLRAQAEELSATAARIASNLEQIRGTGQDEAIAIDGASERATASLRDLIDAMRGQIQAIETNFQEAVDNTVGRVTGAGDAASAEIRTAAHTASHAIGEAGARIANDVSRASDGALENARIIGEELGQHAANVGESFEAAVARASDRLVELSREALVRAESFTQEMSGQAEQTSALFERVEQVSENAAQRTRESAEVASASVAQTAQSLEAAVTSIRLEVDVMTDGLRT